MTDRELLERAAKAAGIKGTYNGVTEYFYLAEDQPDPGGLDRKWWDPLTDDGDALRLAVDLQLGVSVPPVSDGRVDVVTFYGPIVSIVEYPKNGDRHAATRRAIVRAAAEIGKGMK